MKREQPPLIVVGPELWLFAGLVASSANGDSQHVKTSMKGKKHRKK